MCQVADRAFPGRLHRVVDMLPTFRPVTLRPAAAERTYIAVDRRSGGSDAPSFQHLVRIIQPFLAGYAQPILPHPRMQETTDHAEEAFIADPDRGAGHRDIMIDPVKGNHHTLPTIGTSRIG